MPVKLRSAILLKDLRIEIEVWAKGRGVRKKGKRKQGREMGMTLNLEGGRLEKQY